MITAAPSKWRFAVVKQADETVNNSTTLQDDDELKFDVAANAVYLARGVLLSYSSVTADIKHAFTVPAATEMRLSAIYRSDNGSNVSVNGLDATTAFNSYGGAETAVLTWWAVIIVGATAGTVQLQWAQRAAEVSDTKVLANSCIEVSRIA